MQKSPVQPGVQWQAPSSELQRAPLWQLHVWKQAGPQNPGGQAGGGRDGRVRARQRGAEGRQGEGGRVHVRVKMPGCTQVAFPDYGWWWWGVLYSQNSSVHFLAQPPRIFIKSRFSALRAPLKLTWLCLTHQPRSYTEQLDWIPLT